MIVNPLPPGANPNPHIIKYVVSSARRASHEAGLGAVFGIREAMRRLNTVDTILVFGSLALADGWLTTLSRRCRESAIPICYWSTEDPYEFDLNKERAELFDWIWTTDKASIPFYDAPNVEHLPLAADIDTHFLDFPEDESSYWYDLSFIGAQFDFRRRLVNDLTPLLRTLKTVIIGPNWTLDESFVQVRRVTNQDATQISNRSRVVLNMSRRDFNYINYTGITPSTPGPRTFEVAASGTVQVVMWDQPEVREYYEIGREIVFADGINNLKQLIRDLISDSSKRRQIAQQSAARTRSAHTYDHRMTVVMNRFRKLRGE